MELISRSVEFDFLSGDGPRKKTYTEIFARNVDQAVTGLQSFSTGFGDKEDHHLGEFQIRLDTSFQANVVEVEITYGLRDWSNEWDDKYGALIIEFFIIAELEPAAAGPVREDLIIKGMEYNQATQFFRSAQHLDAASVEDDNSIPLIANKTTAVRVYVDYDANSGLPPINSLSGELVVSTATTTFPVAPMAPIVPRRDSQIDRSQIGHTLNFLIDEQWCKNRLTLRCHVFDDADPTQISTTFTDDIQFIEVATLNVYMVGVNYTGQDLDLAAPTIADFKPNLWFTESTFPIGEVIITGYNTLDDFNADMNADTGCGDGFQKLLGLIRDLKGDSNDIYCGVLPDGIDFGSYNGCGRSKEGIAMTAVSKTAVWAHEIGHTLGREHAPCDVPSRCDSPGNPDPDYPNYNSYASDSIGEYGFGRASKNNTDYVVKDPAVKFDLMGYSSGAWISPHTYVGLLQWISPNLPSSASVDGTWNPVKGMLLHLNLVIDRQRKVRRVPSFHYPALKIDYEGEPTTFEVELLDDCHQVIGCHTLSKDRATCGTSCWPMDFFERIPFPEGAKWLVVWEGQNLLYEECIPEPPSVSVKCKYDPDNHGFIINWSATAPDTRDCDLWYLVQWEDVNETWRGLMPRTQETSAFLPARLLGRQQKTRVRVLASSGIATGTGQCKVALPDPTPFDIAVVLAGEPMPPVPEPTPVPVPIKAGIITVFAVENSGRMIIDPGFIWFDDDGREIARGRRLDLRKIENVRLIKVVVSNYTSRTDVAHRVWRIERSPKEFLLWPKVLNEADESEPGDKKA